MTETFKEQDISAFIDRLPPFPSAVKNLMDALDKDFVKPEELERLLMACPIIAGRVLQIANSSFYGQRRQIVSLKQAIIILGISTLKGLIYTLSVMQNLEDNNSDNKSFKPEFLWRHSLFSACIAKTILEHHLELDGSHVFTASLFQHLGLMIVHLLDPDTLDSALKKAQAEQRTLFDMLLNEAHINYFSISAMALNQWGFPAEVCEVIELIEGAYKSNAMNKTVCPIMLSAVISNGFGCPIQESCIVPVISEDCLASCFPRQEIANDCLYKADIMFMELKKVILA